VSSTDDDQQPTDADSPLDRLGASERLEARVVDPRARARIHGYAVHDDLARHYSYGEVLLLILTGDVPSPPVGRAFEVALTFMTPVSIAEAPAHAARLGQRVDASVSGVVSVAAAALGEQARWLLDEHAGVLSWLDGARDEFPDAARAEQAEEREYVDSLRAAVCAEIGELAAFSQDPALWPALLAVLHACGLRRADQLLPAIVQARLCAAVAEATAVDAGRLQDYPVNVPPIRYSHERDPNSDT
jgi:hypothetical protein